jgi:hypothetical protein
MPRRLFPVTFDTLTGPQRIEGSYTANHLTHVGHFEISSWISLISEPGDDKPTSMFVAPAGTTVLFVSQSARLAVSSGRFTQEVMIPLDQPNFDCVQGASTFLERPGAAISDLFGAKPKKAPEPPKAADQKTLSDLFVEQKRPPPNEPMSIAPPTQPVAPEERKDEPGLAVRENKRDTIVASALCDAGSLKPLKVAIGANLKPLQTVGFRNAEVKAAGYDYISAAGDAVPIGATVDVGDSASSWIGYEVVGVGGAAGEGKSWISFPGVDKSRLSTNAVTPSKILRVVVIGGVSEVAMSGLDLVGPYLAKQTHETIRVEIEWHIVDGLGSLAEVVRFESFGALVKAAAERARGRSPDVLNEAQLLKLLDGFERVVTMRVTPVEKVFWIKGASLIPSSVPQRFERLIEAISGSDAIPHTPSGSPVKWLFLVSAHTAGFSINYLKEPIFSHRIGDVIEESADAPRAAARTLISDTNDINLLATRLRLAAVASAAGTSNARALSGTLVLRDSDILADRGYAISRDAIDKFRDNLRNLATSLNVTSLNPTDLERWAIQTARPYPTFADIFQFESDGSFFRLPKTAPEWARKPLKELNESELHNAQALVTRSADGFDKVMADMLNAEAKDKPACRLLFVSERAIGFEKR